MDRKKNITYTSTLPSVVMEEVVAYATKKKITKNKLIEAAVRNFLDAEIRSELERTFKLAAEDPELTEMAENGD